MNYKKCNPIDIANLIEGIVNEVCISNNINIFKIEYSIVFCDGNKQDLIVEDARLYNYHDIAFIINETIVKNIGISQPLVDCGEYYMTITDYLKSELKRCSVDVNHVLLSDNRFLFSCFSGNNIYDIWDWHIGFSDGEKENCVSIGDVRQTFLELFNSGSLIEDMVNKLFS